MATLYNNIFITKKLLFTQEVKCLVQQRQRVIYIYESNRLQNFKVSTTFINFLIHFWLVVITFITLGTHNFHDWQYMHQNRKGILFTDFKSLTCCYFRFALRHTSGVYWVYHSSWQYTSLCGSSPGFLSSQFQLQRFVNVFSLSRSIIRLRIITSD